MKKLLVLLVLTMGIQAQAAPVYTRDSCPVRDDEMAALLADYASRGIYDGKGRKECQTEDMKIFPSQEMFRDQEIPNSKVEKIVLTKLDRVTITEVSEFKENGEGTNEFFVKYTVEKQTANGPKSTQGTFSFSRYSDEGLKVMGCAFFRDYPSKPIIREECLPSKKP